MSTLSPPRTGEEFVAELRGLSHRYWGTHPFHHRLHAGELTEHELRVWAANRWYYQSVLPQKDAAIISNCPVPEIRRAWLDRIVYHDGPHTDIATDTGTAGAASGTVSVARTISDTDAATEARIAADALTAADAPAAAEASTEVTGPAWDPNADSGRERWLRLCEAVGLSRTEVLDERHVVPGVRFAVDAYVTFARTRPWVEAIASGLTEMFSGHLMRRRVGDMLANYSWIRPADLAYFTNRIEAVTGEGKSTLDIVVRYCVTREQQDAAIAALSFKCDVLWSMLDAIERAAAKE